MGLKLFHSHAFPHPQLRPTADRFSVFLQPWCHDSVKYVHNSFFINVQSPMMTDLPALLMLPGIMTAVFNIGVAATKFLTAFYRRHKFRAAGSIRQSFARGISECSTLITP